MGEEINTEIQEEDRRLATAQEFCQKRLLAKQKDIVEFLENVALNDKYKDKKVLKMPDGDYAVRDVPASAALRLSAAKLWKEMIADKAVGDVKEKARQRQAGGAVNMKDVIKRLSEEASSMDNTAEEEVEL